MIYCPKTERLFVKDVVIDLSQGNYFSEYPRKARVMKPRKKRPNVWRQFREDSELDVEMALVSDMDKRNFDPSLFLKNKDDIEVCKDILKAWFHKI